MADNNAFPCRIGAFWRPLLLAAGVTPRRASVRIAEDALHVHFGFFQRSYPLAVIASVATRRASWLTGVGVHTDFRGGLYLTGDFGELTEITFREPQRGILPVPLRYRRLGLTLVDAAGFIAALAPRIAPAV